MVSCLLFAVCCVLVVVRCCSLVVVWCCCLVLMFGVVVPRYVLFAVGCWCLFIVCCLLVVCWSLVAVWSCIVLLVCAVRYVLFVGCLSAVPRAVRCLLVSEVCCAFSSCVLVSSAIVVG